MDERDLLAGQFETHRAHLRGVASDAGVPERSGRCRAGGLAAAQPCRRQRHRLLDPDLVVRADSAAARKGAPAEVRGAANWVKGAVQCSRMIPAAQPALVDGEVGIVLAPRGRLFRVLRMKMTNGRISRIEVIAEPATLASLELAVIPAP